MKNKPNIFEEGAAREVAAATPTAAPKGISEEAIAEKTRLGITREQAIEILNNQAAHDAELAKEAKAAKAKK